MMTIVGALSYGGLPTMMPGVGGQYVYSRSARAVWGLLFGSTLFLVIQSGTIVVSPWPSGNSSASSSLQSPPPTGSGTSDTFPRGPSGSMVLGNMDIGIKTANLAGIVIIRCSR